MLRATNDLIYSSKWRSSDNHCKYILPAEQHSSDRTEFNDVGANVSGQRSFRRRANDEGSATGQFRRRQQGRWRYSNSLQVYLDSIRGDGELTVGDGGIATALEHF